jgi:YVTN family beta-propeller protein
MPARSLSCFAVVASLLFSSAAWAGSSNSLMDLSPDGALLLVTNADNGTVTVVDTKERKALREIKVGDKPEGVSWIGAGPLAAVTVYREDLLVFFNALDGTIVKKLKVANEPYGIVVNKDATRAWVTHDYPGAIAEIDLKKLKVSPPTDKMVVAQHKVGSFIRGIAISPDESRLYVTEFYSGILHAVDPASGKVLDSWKGHTTDNMARNVVLHPKRPKAYLSHLRSKITVIDGSGSIFPQLSICDLIPPNDTSRRKSIGMDTYNSLTVVTNPWEAALSPDGKLIYTIYAATNDMNISRTVDDDYKEIEAVGGVVRLGQNPRAVRVSPDGKLVYVYNTMDFEVTIHNGANMAKLGSVKVCEPPKTPEWVRGKILFGMALPPMTNPRWVACSSCHPDGLSDGRVWQNPEGLRKTPHMFGMAHTHPLHWSADRDEVQDFEYTIRSKLMRGSGLVTGPIKPKQGFKPVELEENLAGRSKDLDALAIYCNSFEATMLSPHIPAPGKLSEAAERGKTLFNSKQVGCAVCHSGPYYTDSSLKKPFNLHDVGTGKDDPSEKIGPKYDTPSLLYVYRTAPYLHHGKAKTLHDVLTTANKGDKHGKTSQLKANEVDDLVEFLKSLPYEKPPLETPNTVKYRVPPKKDDDK